jgi:hypothetical protein
MMNKSFKVRCIDGFFETPYGWCNPAVDFPEFGMDRHWLCSKKALVPGLFAKYQKLSHEFLLNRGSDEQSY